MTAFWFWIIVAIAFAVAEVMTVAFFAAFITIGALAAAVVSLLGFGLLVQAIVLGVIGVVGIFAARPFLVERLHIGRRRLQSGAEGMIGQRAVLTEPILGSGQPGHVKIAGELWPAITEDGSPLPATTPVIVTDLHSTVLIVRAASSPSASSPSMPPV
jgi:membrane protein implicated in regulation of membrane protease activity